MFLTIAYTCFLQVVVRGGNELEARLVGHSTVYHASSHSLLVYGGIRVDIARSVLHSTHFMYHYSYQLVLDYLTVMF